ncbi:MAG: uracil phosphoribosyltransferase, partial [Actinomycetota bacterium]
LDDDPVAGIQLKSLRDAATTPEHFRHHARRLGSMLALHAASDIPGVASTVDSPLGAAPAYGPGRTIVAVPVLRAERSAGRDGEAAARMIAAWTAHLDGRTEVQDTAAERILAGNTGPDRVRRLLGVVDPGLAADDDVVALVDRLAGDLRS